ncbi:hypothetical protein CAPTEDRAFT_187487 [Capitella teleta]|uniref:Uncharacterized protein n=1 Tax=Capitella teleta TaxID=283909 RepID=R7TMQ6_CAPTE|nr:hypothetical protein CAPTEDRAFT_187487 [Capitella teleta]|eukprot:ELT95158.1 hypothetical protein CAPTEDRAFT_187487 [Capitella teleta]
MRDNDNDHLDSEVERITGNIIHDDVYDDDDDEGLLLTRQESNLCSVADLLADPTQSVAPFSAALKLHVKNGYHKAIEGRPFQNLIAIATKLQYIDALEEIFWRGLWSTHCSAVMLYDSKEPIWSFLYERKKTNGGNPQQQQQQQQQQEQQQEANVLEVYEAVLGTDNITVQEARSLKEQEDSLCDFLKAARAGDLNLIKEIVLLQKTSSYASQEIASLLVNSKDSRGNTVLHHACASGNPLLVRFLILLGCNVTLRNHHQKLNLLHITITHGSRAVLKELLKEPWVRAHINEETEIGENPLTLCAKRGSVTMLMMLIRAGAAVAIYSHEMMCVAVNYGRLTFLKFCHERLRFKFLSKLDRRGQSLFHNACTQSDHHILTYLLQKCSPVLTARLLFQSNTHGCSPMHTCCESVVENVQMLNLLLKENDKASNHKYSFHRLRRLVSNQDQRHHYHRDQHHEAKERAMARAADQSLLLGSQDHCLGWSTLRCVVYEKIFYFIIVKRHLLTLFENMYARGDNIPLNEFGKEAHWHKSLSERHVTPGNR